MEIETAPAGPATSVAETARAAMAARRRDFMIFLLLKTACGVEVVGPVD
jgi:hypothetical protein